MDIGPALPQPTNLAAFLFLPYASITVEGARAGILLCLGITSDELAFIRQAEEGRTSELVSLLKQSNVYPFTDLSRSSVLRGGGIA